MPRIKTFIKSPHCLENMFILLSLPVRILGYVFIAQWGMFRPHSFMNALNTGLRSRIAPASQDTTHLLVTFPGGRMFSVLVKGGLCRCSLCMAPPHMKQFAVCKGRDGCLKELGHEGDKHRTP